MPVAYDPRLRLAISDDPAPTWFTDEEEVRTRCAQAGDPFVVEEWRSYFVKFYDEPDPFISLLKDRNAARRISPCLWEFNFRNYVGLSRIGGLNIDVQNKKISATLYQAMLDELAEHYASLVFAFGSPVGQHYDKAGLGKDSAFVEYLFLCKHLLHGNPDLDGIGDIIAHDPHRKFEKERLSCPIGECDGADIGVIQTIITGPMARLRDGHPLERTHLASILRKARGRAFFPVAGVKERKYLTVDTHENRFIKFFLRMLLAKVEALRDALGSRTGSYFNPEISDNLEALERKIGQFLAHNMWREVGEMRFVPASSQVLQRKEGYRQLFRLYSLLQLATRCDFLETDFRNLVEIKDVPTLYEYWCFFQVKAAMDSLAPMRGISRIVHENPLSHELSSGLCVAYEGGAHLYFNKTYQGSAGLSLTSDDDSYTPMGGSYSHTLRPDIVIAGASGQKLILDAKYKGQRPDFYCEEEEGTIQRWKDEDIDKMHTYREAIEGVVGSFILYPGTQDMFFPRHGAESAINGVGALALQPGENTNGGATGRRQLLRVIEAFLRSEGESP